MRLDYKKAKFIFEGEIFTSYLVFKNTTEIYGFHKGLLVTEPHIIKEIFKTPLTEDENGNMCHSFKAIIPNIDKSYECFFKYIKPKHKESDFKGLNIEYVYVWLDYIKELNVDALNGFKIQVKDIRNSTYQDSFTNLNDIDLIKIVLTYLDLGKEDNLEEFVFWYEVERKN